jgi:hypothetical protein
MQLQRSLIGMVHVAALPGSARSRLSIGRIADQAAREAEVLADAGFDAVMIENMHDRPYVCEHGPQVVAAMTAVALRVRDAIGGMTMGVQILSNGEHEALAVALACGASFIRCENFVFSHVGDEGLMSKAAAGELLRFRKGIGAGRVRIYADVQKKHASHAITDDMEVGELARAAEFFLADGVIVTGATTGHATDVDDVRAVREAVKIPVLVGSGATPDQLAELFRFADGVIVGSSIKRAGRWENPVDEKRARAMVRAARAARKVLARS